MAFDRVMFSSSYPILYSFAFQPNNISPAQKTGKRCICQAASLVPLPGIGMVCPPRMGSDFEIKNRLEITHDNDF